MSVEIYDLKCAKCGSEEISEDFTNIEYNNAETYFDCKKCGAYNKATFRLEKTEIIEYEE